jgi:hypothetical protein
MDRPSLPFGFRDSTHDDDSAQGHYDNDERREDDFIDHVKADGATGMPLPKRNYGRHLAKPALEQELSKSH